MGNFYWLVNSESIVLLEDGRVRVLGSRRIFRDTTTLVCQLAEGLLRTTEEILAELVLLANVPK